MIVRRLLTFNLIAVVAYEDSNVDEPNAKRPVVDVDTIVEQGSFAERLVDNASAPQHRHTAQNPAEVCTVCCQSLTHTRLARLRRWHNLRFFFKTKLSQDT
jgi:hypothetical protein